jgi:hypothetical protein
MGLHLDLLDLLDLLWSTRRSHRTLAHINHLGWDPRLRHYPHINNRRIFHPDHHLLTGHLTLEFLEVRTRTMINLTDRVTKGIGTNVVTDHHHEADEGGPNRVVGEEEAVDGIGTGIGEGIGTGTGTEEIDRGILVGRREVGGAVVLGGVNALGHENFPKSQLLL